jgi:Sec-independent protein translocase protein TatA
LDIFGVSPVELIVVMLIAILVLGPARSAEVGRNIGKYWVKVQQTLKEISDTATEEIKRAESQLKIEPTMGPESSVPRLDQEQSVELTDLEQKEEDLIFSELIEPDDQGERRGG